MYTGSGSVAPKSEVITDATEIRLFGLLQPGITSANESREKSTHTKTPIDKISIKDAFQQFNTCLYVLVLNYVQQGWYWSSQNKN